MNPGPYFVSPAAPAWRQPCNCEAYAFPHRPLSGKCRASLDIGSLIVREARHDERATFDAVEARSINAHR
jgi:hypothetical protein